MKTLIFNGSPRKNGNTSFLVNALAKKLDGDVKIVTTYMSPIEPCKDCRYCWKKPGCSIKDGMQEIYEDIKSADNVIVASPLNFSEISGSMLNVLSRLQAFYSNKRFLGLQPAGKRKKGAAIICGGGDGGVEKALSTAKELLRSMNAKPDKTVLSLQTDTVPSAEDQEALRQLDELAAFLNQPAE